MSDTTINLFVNIMWKSVILHITAISNILEILKTAYFMGFRFQYCFQILTLEIEKCRFKHLPEAFFFGGEGGGGGEKCNF